jgi:hypothetical protein
MLEMIIGGDKKNNLFHSPGKLFVARVMQNRKMTVTAQADYIQAICFVHDGLLGSNVFSARFL